jgi:hypothetical protein
MGDMTMYQMADLVAAVGVVVLVYYLVVKPNYNVSVSAKAGMSNKAGSTLAAMVQQRSDATGGNVMEIDDLKRSGFSVGGYEPPVFWSVNKAVHEAQSKGIAHEPDSGKDGMRNYEGRYVEGMSKFEPSKLDAALNSL